MPTYDVRFEASNDIAGANNRHMREAKAIIEDSLPTFIDKHSRSGTLVKKTLVRLNLQGQFNKNGIRYANLKIQLNQPRLDTQGGEEE